MSRPIAQDDGTRRRDPARSAQTQRLQDEQARPLLPPVIANSVVDISRTMAGVLILAAVATIGTSLASWSPTDPSFSHVTSAAIHNLLGRPGADCADLLIDTLGLAALALLLPPIFWSLALIQREPLVRPLRRLITAGLATLATATALTLLPVPDAWPSNHGLGGIAGEAITRVLLTTLALNQPPIIHQLLNAGLGLVMALIAVVALRAAIGFPSTHTARSVRTGRWFPSRSKRAPHKADRNDPATSRFDPTLPMALASERMNPGPRDAKPAATRPAASISPREAQKYGRYAATIEIEPSDEDDSEFDTWTNAASTGIAARFAPSTNGPRALQDTLSDAFAAPHFESAPFATPVFEPTTFDNELPSTGRDYTARTSLTQPTQTKAYKRPSLNLLERPRTQRVSPGFASTLLRGTARLLEDVLAEFGVMGTVRSFHPGPIVTVYEFEPKPGTRADRVIALADDIARGMGVPSARVAPIAGRVVLAIELPNEHRETIYLRDIFDAEAYRSTMDALPIALGLTSSGSPLVGDLALMPNLLVAGGNGSGKSVGINGVILSLIYKHGPDNCRFLMIDQRQVELSRFDGIPHLLTPVITDPHKAVTALAWCVSEMEERMKRMAALGVRTIDVFNNRVRNAKKRGERLGRTVQTGFDETTGKARFEHEEMHLEPLPYIVIIIEELADLMAVAGRDIEGAVQRLAEAARAAGIHLVVSSERPTNDVLTTPIKAGLPARISYRVTSRAESRAVIGVEGAEHLLGNGDMLYANGVGEPTRVHGAYVSHAEVESVTDALRQNGQPNYIAALSDSYPAARSTAQRSGTPRPTHATSTAPQSFNAESDARPRTGVEAASEDALFDRAVAIVVRERRAHPVILQRRLNISLAWAVQLIAALEEARIIAPADASGFHALRVEQVA